MKIGGHVSIQGGLHKAAERASSIGAQAFAMFCGSPRQWKRKDYTQQQVDQFKASLQKYNFSPLVVLPHANYLINIATPETEILRKSRELFLTEMQQCEQLGLVLYNFHCGSTKGKCTETEALERVAESINWAHQHTNHVCAVIEMTAGAGDNIGYKFEHVRDIIAKVKDKKRVGVCIDTCHIFAAGYDIRTQESCRKVFEEFEKLIGYEYLKGFHLNDSKDELGSHLDHHENIGKGYIGLDCFKFLVNHPKLKNIPLVLETPGGNYKQEIKLLYSLITNT